MNLVRKPTNLLALTPPVNFTYLKVFYFYTCNFDFCIDYSQKFRTQQREIGIGTSVMWEKRTRRGMT